MRTHASWQILLALREGWQNMRIGITGHQARSDIDWGWVRSSIRSEIEKSPTHVVGYSLLAEGADQIFAETILNFGGKLVAIIPLRNYETHFSQPGLTGFRRLVNRGEKVELNSTEAPAAAFFMAGKYLVDAVELLIAVWDGRDAVDAGGTGSIVEYAKAHGKPVVQINPYNHSITQSA